MRLGARLRATFRAARVRDAFWTRLAETGRLLLSTEGRARVWTRLAHAREIHQTAPYTWLDRYPEIFELAAKLMPDAERVLSFGCSTGEELVSLRRRFPNADILGAEINPRSRSIARRLTASQPKTSVVSPNEIAGTFDVVFALSVLQRDPRRIAAEVMPASLAARYPFKRFDSGVRSLVARIRPGGLLCVSNCLYRVEDSSSAEEMEPIGSSPDMERTMLGPQGERLHGTTARTIFRKA